MFQPIIFFIVINTQWHKKSKYINPTLHGFKKVIMTPPLENYSKDHFCDPYENQAQRWLKKIEKNEKGCQKDFKN